MSSQQADTKIVIGNTRHGPFVSLKKLLNGFCDPSKIADDDDTAASAVPASPEWRSQKTSVVKRETATTEDEDDSLPDAPLPSAHKDDTSAVVTTAAPTEPNPFVCRDDYDRKTNEFVDEDDDIVEDKAREVETHEDEIDEGVTTEIMIEREIIVNVKELNATHTGSTLRFRRRLEVVVFAVLAVFGTLYTLHRMDYPLAFRIIESPIISEPKRWIQVAYKDANKKIIEQPQEEAKIVQGREETKPAAVHAVLDHDDGNRRAKELLAELKDLVENIGSRDN